MPGVDRLGANDADPTVQAGRPAGNAAPEPFDDEPPF
jgi:hypothetical protein